jgi:ElaB/YqjD/DUF883 family membrane-anchored ribosome-binding protein
MAQEPDVIRQEIEETRASLTDKIETLEAEVRDTVQTARATVEQTIESVKDTVHGTVDSVKQTFDVRHHVEAHPWGMFGGSVLAGLAIGWLLPGRPRPERWMVHRAADSARPNGKPTESLASSEATERWPRDLKAEASGPGLLERLADQFGDEIEKVKGIAIGAAVSALRDLAKQQLPSLAPQIDEVMNSATTKLGGEPIRGPLFENAGAQRRA